MLSEFIFNKADKNGKIISQKGYLISGLVGGNIKPRNVQRAKGNGSFKAVDFGVSSYGEWLEIGCAGRVAESVLNIKQGDFVIATCDDYVEREYNGKIYGKYIANAVIVQPSGASKQNKNDAGNDTTMMSAENNGLPF